MNKLFSLLLLFTLSFSLTSFAFSANQGDDDDKDSYTLKMTQARLKFMDEDYVGALRIYKELKENHADDASLNYRMGECFVKLKDMKAAIEHLEKVTNVDTLANKNLYLLLGQAYHYEGHIDEAIDAYYTYKGRLQSRKISLTDSEKHYVNLLLKQCLTAKELMSKPVKVNVKNLGDKINSEFTDANPSITADGKTLIFTSRRPTTTGGKIDPSVDEYYDDMYMVTRDGKSWGEIKQFESPINTEGHDANLSITPDGSQIFLYKNIEGETNSGDIYVTEKGADGNWDKPKPFGNKYINSSYFESSACLSADGKKLYFVSERDHGGFGNGDIYVATKQGDVWLKPVNLGPEINSVDDEIGVFIHPDGKTIFFSSKGHNTMGGYDIFMSVLEGEKWSTPVNLGYPINTTKDEVHFVFTTDRKTAYISSTRDGGMGKFDIYQVDMSEYFIGNKDIDENIVSTMSGPELSILKGTVVDGTSSEPVIAKLSVIDQNTKEVTEVESNEKGEYFVTLPGDRKYDINVEAKGYKPMNIKLKLDKGVGETFTMTKHIILTKK